MPHDPELILAGRRVNNGMPEVVAERLMNVVGIGSGQSTRPRILVMGYTFKENCPDARNSLVSDLVESIAAKGAAVAIYDPWVSKQSTEIKHRSMLLKEIKGLTFDGIAIAVGHQMFREMGAEKVIRMCGVTSCIFDVKGIFGNQTGFQRL